MTPHVYFLRRADGIGPIKIGCSIRPAARAAQCSAGSPYPLAIIASIPGAWALEWALHVQFAHLRSHGEWFHADAALEAGIAQIIDGSFDLSTLPPPQRLPPSKPRGRPGPRQPRDDARRAA